MSIHPKGDKTFQIGQLRTQRSITKTPDYFASHTATARNRIHQKHHKQFY